MQMDKQAIPKAEDGSLSDSTLKSDLPDLCGAWLVLLRNVGKC